MLGSACKIGRAMVAPYLLVCACFYRLDTLGLLLDVAKMILQLGCFVGRQHVKHAKEKTYQAAVHAIHNSEDVDHDAENVGMCVLAEATS
eukprot:SAG11_NODE_4002_length_2112_cov_4.740841_3_plen_90_part_00